MGQLELGTHTNIAVKVKDSSNRLLESKVFILASNTTRPMGIEVGPCPICNNKLKVHKWHNLHARQDTYFFAWIKLFSTQPPAAMGSNVETRRTMHKCNSCRYEVSTSLEPGTQYLPPSSNRWLTKPWNAYFEGKFLIKPDIDMYQTWTSQSFTMICTFILYYIYTSSINHLFAWIRFFSKGQSLGSG